MSRQGLLDKYCKTGVLRHFGRGSLKPDKARLFRISWNHDPYYNYSSVVSGTAGSVGAEYKLTVKDPSLTIAKTSGSDVTISGNVVTVPYTISGTNAGKATNKEVAWKSSNKKIATVDKNGKVKGIKAGTVKITATAKDGSKKSASCTVTVK